MTRRFAVLATLAAVLGLTVGAQADRLGLGEKCPDFNSLECACGKIISLSDFKRDVLVICITCNHCPMAVAYEDRLIEFNKKFDGKIDFVAINVNNLEQDKLPAMKVRAKEKGFNFYYAYDPSQEIARKLGAKQTPEFFVFNKERKLVYTGAMDDDAREPKTCYLSQAVEAAQNGTAAPKGAKARGCGIKWDKK